MRIFIQHLDSYIGRALVRELRKNAGAESDEAMYNRLFGTLKSPNDSLAQLVKRRWGSNNELNLVVRACTFNTSDERAVQAFVTTLRTCKTVVCHVGEGMPGHTLAEIDFVLEKLAEEAAEDAEGEPEAVKFVLVSSLYASEEAKALEARVLALEGRVTGCVVSAGALYGDGESAAFEAAVQTVFVGKDKLALPSNAAGDGVIPTCHVGDVGRLVKALTDAEEGVAGSTHVAVDGSSMSMKDIYQSLVDGVAGDAGKYAVGAGKSEASGHVAGLGGLAAGKPEGSALMTAEGFAWTAKDGFGSADTVKSVWADFGRRREQQKIKVMFAVSEEDAKAEGVEAKLAELSSAVASHYNLCECGSVEDITGQNAAQLRGYVFGKVAGPSVADVTDLFSEEKEVEVQVVGVDDEGAETTTTETKTVRAPKDACPTHVIALGSSDLSDFFAKLYPAVDVCYLPWQKPNKLGGSQVNMQFESVRMYLERDGVPTNFGVPSEAETNAALADKWVLAEKEAAATTSVQVDTSNLEAARFAAPTEADKLRSKRFEAVLAQEAELKGMSTRNFLGDFIVPSLSEGLIEVLKLKPEDPTDYLANYLEKRADDFARARKHPDAAPGVKFTST